MAAALTEQERELLTLRAERDALAERVKALEVERDDARALVLQGGLFVVVSRHEFEDEADAVYFAGRRYWKAQINMAGSAQLNSPRWGATKDDALKVAHEIAVYRSIPANRVFIDDEANDNQGE